MLLGPIFLQLALANNNTRTMEHEVRSDQTLGVKNGSFPQQHCAFFGQEVLFQEFICIIINQSLFEYCDDMSVSIVQNVADIASAYQFLH